jgi:hypothetical protein
VRLPTLPKLPASLTRLKLPQLPDEPPKYWPRFSSPLHSPAVTARVGRILGIFITVCFITGLLSHYQYQPWSWLPEPASPAWGYRLTQGLHVITGITTIPLLLVKLWTVYPKLFAWPPAKSVVDGLERGSIAILVSATLLELATGFMNILRWYAWPWGFVYVHYALAFVIAGSLLLHIAVKLPIIREGLATKITRAPVTPTPMESPESPSKPRGISRRGLLIASAGGVGAVALTTVGQTFSPLESIALLAPRRPSKGPQRLPVNRTAGDAQVTKLAVADSYRLQVTGKNSFVLTRAEIEALPAVDRVIPLACVEGWSASARWRGPLLIDLVRRAGGDENSSVFLNSMEIDPVFGSSTVRGPQLAQAVLATHLNGDRIDIDHGYPLRLIAPNRAGVLNTKWLVSLKVS